MTTALAVAIGGLTITGAAHAQEFSAYPMPGTLTAHPETTISFRGGDPAALGAVTVRGSRSGAHRGELERHADGQGASFVPDKPFDEDERGTVSTPATPPKVIARRSGGRVTARVSWNGATEVARWELLDAQTQAPLGQASRDGFETAVSAPGSPAQVAMRAYDAAGNVLATSAPVRPSR